MLLKILKRTSYLAILLFLFSCSKENKTDNLYEFKAYISGISQSTISANDPIIIQLTKPVKNWETGEPMDKSILSLSPKVKGTLILEDSTTLVFTPSKKLKNGTVYTAVLSLKKLYSEVPKKLKTFSFQLETIEQDAYLETQEFQSEKVGFYTLVCTVHFADFTEINQVKNLFSINQEDHSELEVDWEESSTPKKQFKFTIRNIKRPSEDDESNIVIKASGRSIDSDFEINTRLLIPGKQNFKIISSEVIQEDDTHYLKVSFSDPLSKDQNFKNFISLEDYRLTFEVDGNLLLIFPRTAIERTVSLAIKKGVRNKLGTKLEEDYTQEISFEELKPAVKLLNSGIIMPSSTGLKLNFEAVNLRAVDIHVVRIYEENILQFLQKNDLGNPSSYYDIRRVGRKVAQKTIELITLANYKKAKKSSAYTIDLSKIINAEPGAIYKVEFEFKKEYSLYNCEEGSTQYILTTPLKKISEEISKEEAAYWDNRKGLYKDYQDYHWNEKDDPCSKTFYIENGKVTSAYILASDIGLIAKKGSDGSYHFATTDLLTAKPISGVTVTLYNYQKKSMASEITDTEGLCVIKNDALATFAIASKDNHKTYIKLNDGLALSMSEYQISGERLKENLKGFIYTERGVWRPGDSIHVTFVLNDKLNPLPENHPITMLVNDAKGKEAHRETVLKNQHGFYTFVIPTQETDPTGNWECTFKVGNTSFSKRLSVETIKPNRLKLDLETPKNLFLAKNPIEGGVSVKWLHGAIAKDVRVTIDAKISTQANAFIKNFKDYHFNDITKRSEFESQSILDKKTDAQGNVPFSQKVDFSKKAAGLLKLTFLMKAYEAGGDFSTGVQTRTYAPFPAFVGIKKLSGHFLDTDTPNTFQIRTVSPQGKSISVKNLEVQVFKLEWRWWWNSSGDNLSKYDGTTFQKSYKKIKVSTNATGKGSFQLNIPEEDEGRYLIKVVDKKGGHATGLTTYFYENWWSRASENPNSPAMLMFKTDKEAYTIGETATVTFPSSAGGNALVSIEKSNRVLKQFWVQTESGETQFELPVSEDMTPNSYINISLLQPHASTANDLPIRLYGVTPIYVEDATTKLSPEIKMSEELAPEKAYKIKVKEQNGKPMTYTLAVVDEGLLNLTNYKTPAIWDSFYAKEALAVKTWDIYNDVMGAYNGSIDQVFSIGGDKKTDGVNPNGTLKRFKPVVQFLGPFELKSGKTATHTLQMPNYVGSVKAMVIAGNNELEAYGSTQKSVPVKKPLMVLASVPRKISPKEKITVPVTVFAMDKKIKSVSVSVKASSNFTVIGSKTKQLTFSQTGEKMVFFELDVKDLEGMGTIEITASGNRKKALYKVDLPVINPNPITTKQTQFELAAGESKAMDVETFGVKGSNFVDLEAMTLPSLNLSERLRYLIQYPHGCVEQTTSSVFPQLFITDLVEVSTTKKRKIERNIKNGITRLTKFQTSFGGLGYWMGDTEANDWGTSYAGHFILEAEKKGYHIPNTFKKNWLSFQQRKARDWRSNGRSYHYTAQAYRLYTLALANTPAISEMNRLRSVSNLSKNAKWRLAAAYSLAGQKEVAKRLLAEANASLITQSSNSNDSYTYGSALRNYAMLMESLILADLPHVSYAKQIASLLSSNNWYSTQTTAFSLVAMAKMAIKSGDASRIKISYKLNNKKKSLSANAKILQESFKSKVGSHGLEIKNEGKNILYITVINGGKLALGSDFSLARNLEVETTFELPNSKKIAVTQLQQGTEFLAKIKIKNLSDIPIHDIALTQLFPSGWEIINTRYTELGNSHTGDVDFADIRDDRVHFYFKLQAQESKTVTVRLNASFLGTYYLFGTQAEAMYNSAYLTRNKGAWVEVIP